MLPGVHWLRPVGFRLIAWWPAKLLGTTLGMTAFFIAYFWVLNHPLYPVTMMPLIAPDRWITFQPAALPVYLSLWLYVSLAPALLVSRRELISFGVAWTALSVAGLGLFLLWPTAVPRTAIEGTEHPLFAFLQQADAAGNACPSLHVAFAVFTAIWFARLLRQMGAGRGWHAFNWLWCVGILWSTLATRQHVALDVLAGAGLGALVAAAHLSWLGAGTTQQKP